MLNGTGDSYPPYRWGLGLHCRIKPLIKAIITRHGPVRTYLNSYARKLFQRGLNGCEPTRWGCGCESPPTRGLGSELNKLFKTS